MKINKTGVALLICIVILYCGGLKTLLYCAAIYLIITRVVFKTK